MSFSLGGLLGMSGSSSSKSNTTSTTNTTTSTTKVGDVGVTGDNAVAMVRQVRLMANVQTQAFASISNQLMATIDHIGNQQAQAQQQAQSNQATFVEQALASGVAVSGNPVPAALGGFDANKLVYVIAAVVALPFLLSYLRR